MRRLPFTRSLHSRRSRAGPLDLHPPGRTHAPAPSFAQVDPRGTQDLRQRVAIEHALAHVGRRQGPRARYLGVAALARRREALLLKCRLERVQAVVARGREDGLLAEREG
jgi:hypothetical protein